ncbi:MAG: hypothetical protein ABUL44_01140, partial [Flavobacterium sp.]
FKSEIWLSDSIEKYNGSLSDTNSTGCLLRVYNFSNKDSFLIKKQVRLLNFKKLPFTNEYSYPLIQKYYESCSNGYYKDYFARGELFHRIEIVNFDEGKFIIFQSGG